MKQKEIIKIKKVIRAVSLEEVFNAPFFTVLYPNLIPKSLILKFNLKHLVYKQKKLPFVFFVVDK